MLTSPSPTPEVELTTPPTVDVTKTSLTEVVVVTTSTAPPTTTTTTEIPPHSESFNVPKFSGRSFIQLKDLAHGHLEILIEMNFRSTSANGILLYTGQNGDDSGGFMSLALNNGYVEFRYNLGSGTKVLRTKEVTLNVFHKVTAMRFGRDGVLKLDGGKDVTGVSPGTLQSLNDDMPLYIGLVGNVNGRILKNVGVSQGLTGCIETLRIASQKLNIEYDLKMPGSMDIEQAYRIADCDIEPCNKTECVNGGTCVLDTTNNNYHCNCTDGHSGPHCEIKVDSNNNDNNSNNYDDDEANDV
jgi:coxsackievirus/adenovirus receptor